MQSQKVSVSTEIKFEYEIKCSNRSLLSLWALLRKMEKYKEKKSCEKSCCTDKSRLPQSLSKTLSSMSRAPLTPLYVAWSAGGKRPGVKSSLSRVFLGRGLDIDGDSEWLVPTVFIPPVISRKMSSRASPLNTVMILYRYMYIYSHMYIYMYMYVTQTKTKHFVSIILKDKKREQLLEFFERKPEINAEKERMKGIYTYII